MSNFSFMIFSSYIFYDKMHESECFFNYSQKIDRRQVDRTITPITRGL